MSAPLRPRAGPLLAALLAAACSEPPTAPPGPVRPELTIMIDLPTIRLEVAGTERYLVTEVSVTRGIVQADASDRFHLRTTARLTHPALGDGLLVVGECPVADLVKDGQLRKGEMVPVTATLAIDAVTWDALVSADAGAGDGIGVSAVIELLLRDGAGKERLLNQVEATATIDPDP